MVGLYVVLLALATIAIRSSTFQPLFCIFSSNGAYFSIFSCKNLSLDKGEFYLWVKVNFINCIIICGAGCIDESSM